MFDFLGSAPRDRIDPSPLTQVVAQIKFPSQRALSSADGVSELHEKLALDYPRMLPEPQVVITAGPHGASSAEVPRWRFTDLNGAWSVVLTAESLQVETTRYSTWGEMQDRLDRALTSLTDTVDFRVCERLGLRYINEVPADADGGFEGLVRLPLLGFVQDPAWRRNLQAYMCQTQVVEGETRLFLRHGTGPSVVVDSTKYIIDIECSREKPAEFSASDVLDNLTEMNDVCLRCFYACMESDFETRMPVGEG